MVRTEHGAEQVEPSKNAALRAPVGFVELHVGMERAAEHAVSERAIGHHADTLQYTREDFPLHPAVEHVPAVLHDINAPQPHAGFQLSEAKIRYTDIARFALADDVVENAHRLLERHVWIGPVNEIDIDVISGEIADSARARP